MPRQIIWEVRQRSAVDPSLTRELGCFTDDYMAEQAIHALYREAWKVVLSGDFVGSLWFPVELGQQVATQGFDTWAVNNMNGLLPIFYKVPHELWNQIPSSLGNFNFSMEGAELI